MAQLEHVEHVPTAFTSEGTRCAASLYRPDESQTTGDPPVVVMANGFGLPRRAGLPAVAERLAEHGLAAMTFDYRSLGESDGRPRNVIIPRSQVADWRAAVGHARTIDGVDGEHIGVWGFSLGGGAFATAARAFLTFGLYRPVSRAREIDCPVLRVEAADDRVVPRSAIEAAASRLADVKWVTYGTAHFGAFLGRHLAEAT